jgi:hypothetical protein
MQETLFAIAFLVIGFVLGHIAYWQLCIRAYMRDPQKWIRTMDEQAELHR